MDNIQRVKDAIAKTKELMLAARNQAVKYVDEYLAGEFKDDEIELRALMQDPQVEAFIQGQAKRIADDFETALRNNDCFFIDGRCIYAFNTLPELARIFKQHSHQVVSIPERYPLVRLFFQAVETAASKAEGNDKLIFENYRKRKYTDAIREICDRMASDEKVAAWAESYAEMLVTDLQLLINTAEGKGSPNVTVLYPEEGLVHPCMEFIEKLQDAVR